MHALAHVFKEKINQVNQHISKCRESELHFEMANYNKVWSWYLALLFFRVEDDRRDVTQTITNEQNLEITPS